MDSRSYKAMMISEYGCLLVTTATLLFVMIFAYLRSNGFSTTGYTGANPYSALWIFIPAAVGAITSLVVQPTATARRWWIFAIALLGIVWLIVIDQANVLLNYDVWLKRGIP